MYPAIAFEAEIIPAFSCFVVLTAALLPLLGLSLGFCEEEEGSKLLSSWDHLYQPGAKQKSLTVQGRWFFESLFILSQSSVLATLPAAMVLQTSSEQS